MLEQQQQKQIRKQPQKYPNKNPAVANHTGIPFQLKRQYEKSSGFSFDDVRVHYNSEKPKQLRALAYTQGSQVYIGPGQQKHLGHELGHVIQQKQGRVKPENKVNGLAINTNMKLELEADKMGEIIQHRADNFNLDLCDSEKKIGDTCVVQRFPSAISKATSAVIYAKKHISPGNQRGAVISTEGASMVNLILLRRHVDVIIDDLRDILTRSPNPVTRTMAESVTYHEQILPFVSAQLALLLKSGNCGEFANVVYKYLIETSGNHLQIYACSFNTADHAFNLVYRSDSADTPLFNDALGMLGFERRIMVADAWADIKTSLAEFLAGNNPYDRAFNLGEIDINNKHKGINSLVLSPEAIQYITLAAARISSEFRGTEAVDIATEAIRGGEMNGVYGFVEEGKPETYTSDYIIEKLIYKISGRAHLLHSISLLQRKEVFDSLNQYALIDLGFRDLYNRCMEMYNSTEKYDILH